MLIILISNAIKYNQKGTTIDIKVGGVSDKLEVSVEGRRWDYICLQPSSVIS